MMPSVKLIVIGNGVCESRYTVNEDRVIKTFSQSIKYEHNKLRRHSNRSAGDNYIYDDVISTPVDGIFLHYFIKELKYSGEYRKCVISNIRQQSKLQNNIMVFILIPPNKQIIDYQWSERATKIAWERAELDHAMSWLSTLGGAFSALGEEFSYCNHCVHNGTKGGTIWKNEYAAQCLCKMIKTIKTDLNNDPKLAVDLLLD